MSLSHSEHSIRSESTWDSTNANTRDKIDNEPSVSSSPAFVPRKRTSHLQSSSSCISSASNTYTGVLSLFVQTPFSSSFVRWYIVAMACGLQAVNGLMWMTWGPISSTAEAVFGWDDPVIALQNGIGGLLLVPLCVPAAWMLETGGIRSSFVTSSISLFVGCVLRIIPFPPSQDLLRTVCLTIGASLGGVGAAFVQSAPSSVSVTWFPLRQRNLATALIVLANSAGVALGFFLGPWLVPDIAACDSTQDSSGLPQNASTNCHEGRKINISSTDIHVARMAIDRLFLLHTAFATMFLVCILLYLPERPHNAPSVAAAAGRHSFVRGVRQLTRNWSFWLVILSMALVRGVVPCWASILPIILRPINIDQWTSGLIGTYGQIFCAILAFIFAFIQDRFRGYMRLSIIALNLLGTVAFTIFCLSANHVLPFSSIIVFASLVAGIALPQASLPIGYEFSAELSFPVHESVPNALIVMVTNTFGTCFYVLVTLFTLPGLLVQQGSASIFEQHASLLWWLSVMACALSALTVLFARNRYARLALDDEVSSGREHQRNLNDEEEERGLLSTDRSLNSS